MRHQTITRRREVRKSESPQVWHILSVYFRLSILLTFGLQSCQNEDLDVYKPNESFRRAGDFVKNNYDLSLFNAGLERVGWWEELNGEGPFTVFAPTNEAFNAIGIFRATDFDALDTDSLRFILGCHILSVSLRTEDIPEKSINNHYPTLSGTASEIASMGITDWGAVINDASIYGARVNQRNIVLSNGVLHTLRDVIKYDPDLNIQQRLESMPRFSVLIAGLKKAGRWDQLAGEGPVTVFAASDALFAQAGITPENVDELPADVSDWLFGTYVLPDRQLYVNDLSVFGSSDSWPGGDSPVVYLPNFGDFTYGMRDDKYTVLTMYRPDGFSTFNKQIPFASARTDYRVANGIIHEITQLPLVPDDAPMMDALRAGWTEQ